MAKANGYVSVSSVTREPSAFTMAAKQLRHRIEAPLHTPFLLGNGETLRLSACPAHLALSDKMT